MNTDIGQCYYFALKTYKSDSTVLFENEINAFRGLEKNPGMIKCLLNYTHTELSSYDHTANNLPDNITSNTTHNILLAYGECDLQEYFERHLPPVLEDELLAFWSDLFLVADAVKSIHNFERKRAGVLQPYLGYVDPIDLSRLLTKEGGTPTSSLTISSMYKANSS